MGRVLWRWWRDGLLSHLFPSPAAVSAEWRRALPDLAGLRCCLFVTYVPGAEVPEHALAHATAWVAAGYKVIMVIAADRPELVHTGTVLDFCTGILLRRNQGYDFGAWAAALQLGPSLYAADILAITNDSVYGPLGDFRNLLSRATELDADVIGLTESREKVHHLQSYCLFFKRAALAHPALRAYWERVRGGGRNKVIHSYELTLRAHMVRAGLRVAALFPDQIDRPPGNPTLRDWRALVAAGFPFVKVQLLRDNPLGGDLSGWRELMRDGGYDATIVDRHLGDQRAHLVARVGALSTAPDNPVP